MATKVWESVKVRYCDHVKSEVSLEAQVVYPAEWMPDQPPQVLSHRFSLAFPATWITARAASGQAPTRPSTPTKKQQKSRARSILFYFQEYQLGLD